MHFQDIVLKRKEILLCLTVNCTIIKNLSFVLMVKYMRTWYKHVHTVDSFKRTTSLIIFPKAE